ncbi:MAG: hypothetical protein LH481_05525 [Burkholderiales bacterium]|nr:hypothetical protein [Burkholderiales bacterium]
MNQFTKRNFNSRTMNAAGAMALTVVLLSICGFAQATPSSDEQSLARGAIEDVTPQQKYRTAIREAGGGYKEWLRECDHMPSAERPACRIEAKATYDHDMAQAQLILRGNKRS